MCIIDASAMEEVLAEQKAELLVHIASQFYSDVSLQKQNLMGYAEHVFEAVNTCLEPRRRYGSRIKAPPLLTHAKICDIFSEYAEDIEFNTPMHEFFMNHFESLEPLKDRLIEDYVTDLDFIESSSREYKVKYTNIKALLDFEGNKPEKFNKIKERFEQNTGKDMFLNFYVCACSVLKQFDNGDINAQVAAASLLEKLELKFDPDPELLTKVFQKIIKNKSKCLQALDTIRQFGAFPVIAEFAGKLDSDGDKTKVVNLFEKMCEDNENPKLNALSAYQLCFITEFDGRFPSNDLMINMYCAFVEPEAFDLQNIAAEKRDNEAVQAFLGDTGDDVNAMNLRNEIEKLRNVEVFLPDHLLKIANRIGKMRAARQKSTPKKTADGIDVVNAVEEASVAKKLMREKFETADDRDAAVAAAADDPGNEELQRAAAVATAVAQEASAASAENSLRNDIVPPKELLF